MGQLERAQFEKKTAQFDTIQLEKMFHLTYEVGKTCQFDSVQ